MPENVHASEDVADTRRIISGRVPAIRNPPGAWAVAERDAPEVAARLWHPDTPSGPSGRFRG